MKRILLSLALLFATEATLAATSIILTTPQEDAVCASRGGCGGVAPPPLVCVPPKVIDPTGTQCVNPTPPPTPSACSGFDNVRLMDMPWTNAARIFTKDVGGFGPNDVVVVRFTTGSGPSLAGNLPRINGAEWIDPLYARNAVLSATMCDFSPQTYVLATSNGTSVQVPFTVNDPNNWGYYPILAEKTTYYFNVRNAPGSGCTATCNMFFDLYRAGAPAIKRPLGR